MTTWGRFERELGTTIEDLRRHGELIDKEVNAHNIVESKAMREALRTWRVESLESLAQEQKETNRPADAGRDRLAQGR